MILDELSDGYGAIWEKTPQNSSPGIGLGIEARTIEGEEAPGKRKKGRFRLERLDTVLGAEPGCR